MKRRRLTWSELPSDILINIYKRLNTRLSTLRFRAVCSSWRACCPLPPQHHHHFHRILDDHSLFTACTVYIFEPVEERQNLEGPIRWVVTVDDHGNPAKLSIRYPLSKYQVNGSAKSRFPKVLNLLDFRVTEIGRYYGFISEDRNRRWDSSRVGYCNKDIDKVLVFPDNGFDCAGSADDFAVAVLGEDGSLKVFSLKNRRWTVVHDGNNFLLEGGRWGMSGFKFDDIVSYKGKICGLNSMRGIVCIDYQSFELTYPFSNIHVVRGAFGRKRLVVFNGKMYYVLKDGYSGQRVKVLEYNEKMKRWFMAMSLGEQVFFLGSDSSFWISTQLCPEFGGNCIYTCRKNFRSYFEDVSRTHDWPRFSENDNVGMQFRHPDHDIGRFPIDSDGYFQSLESFHVFWPLVSWVAPNASWSGNPRVNHCASLRITSEAEGKIHQDTEASDDEDDHESVGPIEGATYVNENIQTSSDGAPSVPRSAEIAERESVPVEEVVSKDEIMFIQENENREAIKQHTSQHQVGEGSNPISMQVALHAHPSTRADDPGPANSDVGLRKEDFEVPDAEMDLLQDVLDSHPEAFTRVVAKDAWTRGWAVLPALRAYRLLHGGHGGSLSEAELHQAEGLVVVAENVGVEVCWLRQKLESSWEFYRCRQRAWHRIDELRAELVQLHRRGDEITAELEQLHHLAGNRPPTS